MWLLRVFGQQHSLKLLTSNKRYDRRRREESEESKEIYINTSTLYNGPISWSQQHFSSLHSKVSSPNPHTHKTCLTRTIDSPSTTRRHQQHGIKSKPLPVDAKTFWDASSTSLDSSYVELVSHACARRISTIGGVTGSTTRPSRVSLCILARRPAEKREGELLRELALPPTSRGLL